MVFRIADSFNLARANPSAVYFPEVNLILLNQSLIYYDHDAFGRQ
jgi:hypothetical protein